jgi:hypothetical protein
MDPKFEFEALKYVEGPLYTKHRDAFLAGTPNVREILRRQETQPDWRAKVTAKILLTWLDHRPEAEKLVDDIDHVDWEKERHTVVGIEAIPDAYSGWSSAHPEVHGWLLPLCWEATLKRQKEWSENKRWIFYAMLQVDPNALMNELSVEVMFWYVRAIAESTHERRLGTLGLIGMPPALIRPHALRLQQQQHDLAALLKNDFPELFPDER